PSLLHLLSFPTRRSSDLLTVFQSFRKWIIHYLTFTYNYSIVDNEISFCVYNFFISFFVYFYPFTHVNDPFLLVLSPQSNYKYLHPLCIKHPKYLRKTYTTLPLQILSTYPVYIFGNPLFLALHSNLFQLLYQTTSFVPQAL